MAGSPSDPARRLRRKLILAIFLGRLARQGVVGLACCGSVALILRVALELDVERAAWALAPLLAIPFTAWWGVRRRAPGDEGITAWLDLHTGASGFLLAAYERHDERWAARSAAQLSTLSRFPALRIAGLAWPVLFALSFAALALFVPLSRAAPGPSTSLFDRAIAGLAEKFGALNEIVGLDEVVASEFTERIGQLAENVDAAEPEAMLEAIDTLREELGLEGQEAAELTQELFEQFGAIGMQAIGDPALAQELMFGRLSEMLKSGELPEVLSRLEGLSPDLIEKLTEGELQLPEGFELDPEQLQALSEEMLNVLRDKLGALNLAGLVDLGELSLSGRGTALQDLIDKFHVCDEECEKRGGT